MKSGAFTCEIAIKNKFRSGEESITFNLNPLNGIFCKRENTKNFPIKKERVRNPNYVVVVILKLLSRLPS